MLRPVPKLADFTSQADYENSLRQWGMDQHQSAIHQCAEKERIQRQLNVALEVIAAMWLILSLLLPSGVPLLVVFELVYSELVRPGTTMSNETKHWLRSMLRTRIPRINTLELSFKARHPLFNGHAWIRRRLNFGGEQRVRNALNYALSSRLPVSLAGPFRKWITTSAFNLLHVLHQNVAPTLNMRNHPDLLLTNRDTTHAGWLMAMLLATDDYYLNNIRSGWDPTAARLYGAAN